MGFLNKLWDETLAGPMPDTGLRKLRKYDSFSAKRSLPATVNHHRAYNNNDDYENNNNDKVMITRSITILKSNSGSRSMGSVSPSTHGSPLSSGTPGGDFKKFTRRKSSADGRTTSIHGAYKSLFTLGF